MKWNMRDNKSSNKNLDSMIMLRSAMEKDKIGNKERKWQGR